MNNNNYSQNNLNNNVYESNFTEVINGFNNFDNLSQTSVIQARLFSQNDDIMNNINPYPMTLYENFAMSNDFSYNIPMLNDVSYNNNITISQNNDQNPSPSNNIPSFNSLNITISSPKNISGIFRYGFKIIIMPCASSTSTRIILIWIILK
ncbi:hypothetical protein C1645_824304 [Glomus cerebriforme]|uniref:Uncharacterized protein n=1 Tax=Glomus cerebriforme TaxID=658196 RepID=A0A397SYT0_9GLOM|nr:hypothetical protein C1645_824304 [Glomus cerebriforme]